MDFLPATGNRLIMPGVVGSHGDRKAFVTEVTTDGTIVFDAVIHFKDALGPRPDLAYRSERLTLYPD